MLAVNQLNYVFYSSYITTTVSTVNKQFYVSRETPISYLYFFRYLATNLFILQL